MITRDSPYITKKKNHYRESSVFARPFNYHIANLFCGIISRTTQLSWYRAKNQPLINVPISDNEPVLKGKSTLLKQKYKTKNY